MYVARAIYNSWDEAAVPPRASVEYYDSVNATMGGVEKTKDFFRLFMVPGMGMCPGFGFGNDGTFDAMDVVQKWRVTGVAPDRIVNSHKTAGTVDKTHPACAWPQQANKGREIKLHLVASEVLVVEVLKPLAEFFARAFL